MQTVADVVEGLRAVREHSVVEEALQYVEQQAGGKGGAVFVQAFLHSSPEFIDMWGVWYAQSKQGTKKVTVAVLKTLRALLMVPVGDKDSVHTSSASVICSLHNMAHSLVTTELPVCYNFLSSGDAEKASETLQLLTAAVVRSPDVCMAFLCNFNFTLPALPKLSYRPSKKGHARDFGDSDTNNGQQHDASVPATHECYFNLALAVLRTCPSNGGLKKALQAPQLLPLALQQLTSVNLTSCHLMCEALAARAIHQDDPGGKLAFAKVLRGRVLHELVILASLRSQSGPDRQSTDKHGEVHVHKGASGLQRKCSKLAAAVLRAAALEKHLGLWTTVDVHLCSVQSVAQPGSCLHPSLLHSKVKSGRKQKLVGTHGAMSLSGSMQSHINHMAIAPGNDTKVESSHHLGCLKENDSQSGLLYECRLHCHAAQALRPGKALQGLASYIRFGSSMPQLNLLLDMINLSPELAAAVLANRELMPATVDKHSASMNSKVAVACLSSLSQIATPAHLAVAASHEQLHNQPGTCLHLGLKAGLFSAFLDSVFPSSISQATCSKVLEGGSPEHIRATLSIMKGQLLCVWRLSAALQHQARVCRKTKAAREEGIVSGSMNAEGGPEPSLNNETCIEQVEKASAVVAYTTQKKMPDVKVFQRLLLSLFPALSGGAFEACGTAFPCAKKQVVKNSKKNADSKLEQIDKETEGVCMNIDGMKLRLEDAVPEPSSEEEDESILTQEEAQDLAVSLLKVVVLHIQCAPHTWAVSASSPWKLFQILLDVKALPHWPEAVRLQFLKVLVLSQALPVPCAENTMSSASWSASFLAPVLQHMLECDSNSEDRVLCQDIVYSSLCRLQLHSGPDSVMLPWVIPMLQESSGSNTSQKLDSDAAAAVAAFLVGVVTTCVRRSHTPWGALVRTISAHCAAQQQGISAHEIVPGSSADLCNEAAQSGFVLLFSTIGAAMGRFRSQIFTNPATDGSANHCAASSEAAVWRFVASVTTTVLQSLEWGSTAAAVLMEAILEDIQGSSDRLAQVMSVSWEPDKSHKPGKKCTVKISHTVPAAFRELLEEVWKISCSYNTSDCHLQNGARGAKEAMPGSGSKRKAVDDEMQSPAVLLQSGHCLTHFAVEQSNENGSMQKINTLTPIPAITLITGVFGQKNESKDVLGSSGPSASSCVFQASEDFRALFAAHIYIQSCLGRTHLSEARGLGTCQQLDTARVFQSVLRLPDAHVNFLIPCLLQSVTMCCKSLQQQPIELLQEPASKSSKKASGKRTSKSNQSNAALTSPRDMTATVVAVALCAVCYRRNSWSKEQTAQISLPGSEAKSVLAAVSEAQTAACSVHGLCVAALIAAVAADQSIPPTESVPLQDTDRADSVVHVARIAQLATVTEPDTPERTWQSSDSNAAKTSWQPNSAAAELQRCCASIVNSAQQTIHGEWAPVHILLHRTCVAFIEIQSLQTLACALKQFTDSRASPKGLRSMNDRDICAMLLVSSLCVTSTASVAQCGSNSMVTGVHNHVTELHGAYNCAGEILDHASTYSTHAQCSAITFLKTFWAALGPASGFTADGLDTIATCAVASRSTSLQLIDSALERDSPHDLSSAAAQVVSRSSLAALHAAQAILMALHNDTEMLSNTSQHQSDDSSLKASVLKYKAVLCTLLPVAFMHEHDAPELFAASKQVATLIGSNVRDMLGSTAGDKASEKQIRADQEWLSTLYEACTCFHPLKAGEVQPALLKLMPIQGMSLARTTQLSEAKSQSQSLTQHVGFASRILTSAAQLLTTEGELCGDTHVSTGTTRLLVSEALPATQVCPLVHSLLTSCVNTVAHTLQMQLPLVGTGRGQSQSKHLAALFTQLQPFFDVIDKCLGDLVAALPATSVQSESYKGLAQAAVTHTAAGLTTMGIGGASKRSSRMAARSAQRLWAAMIRSSTSMTSNGEGDACEDVSMGASDEDHTHGNGAIQTQGHHAHDTQDAGCNVAVGKLAMTALGMVMESDEAMQLLFDVPATHSRCALPEDISRLDVPLKTVVMLPGNDTHALRALTSDSDQLSEAQYGVAAHVLDAQLREGLLLLIETLVCCAESHIPTKSSSTNDRQAASLQKQLSRAAQLLLPELLKTYQATMMAEDRACLLVIRALDRVLSSTSRSSALSGVEHEGAAGDQGFLESTGYLWGNLWQAVQSWSSMHVPLMDGLLCRPDMVDPRRMALAALHFAGSRTLALEEQDPFHTASELSRASQAAYCAYDPAFVVPTAAVLLQKGWVSAESVVRAGWMPLLLRCFGSDDNGLREAAYASIACIEESFRQLKEDEEQDASTFREDTQLLSLLALVRSSIDTPCQKLPTASAVFLAEASVAALNPAASIYSHMNHFLLKRASLQLHGVPMLTTLHAGVSGLSSHSQTLARELAIAATAVGHISKVASQALASPDSLDEASAVVRAVLAASRAPNTCTKMLQKGVCTLVAGVVSQCLSAIASTPSRSGVDAESAVRRDVVLVALRALNTCSRTRKLWRAELQHVAAAEFSSVLWSLLNPTVGIANKLEDGSIHGQHQESVLSWHEELLNSILLEILCLARTVLVQTYAWDAEKVSVVCLTSTFWRTVVDLTQMQIKSTCNKSSHRIHQLRISLQQCILCLPERFWRSPQPEVQAYSPSSSIEAHAFSSIISLFTLDLFTSPSCLRGCNEQNSQGSDAIHAVAAHHHSTVEDRWYTEDARDHDGNADSMLVRWLAWTVSAVLQALCMSKQPCTTDVWKPFAGQRAAVRDALCSAEVSSSPARAMDLRASTKSAYVAAIVHTLDAVQRHWEAIDLHSQALHTAVMSSVGHCILQVAATFGAVAAGMQTLRDVWELKVSAQGSEESSSWTAGLVLQIIREKADTLST